MGILTREEILACEDLPQEVVHVEEWRGDVIVRTLTGTERDQFEQTVIGKDLSNVRAALVARCLIDSQGTRVFDDQGALGLGRKSSLVLDRLYGVACRLNGFGKKEEAELAKN